MRKEEEKNQSYGGKLNESKWWFHTVLTQGARIKIHITFLKYLFAKNMFHFTSTSQLWTNSLLFLTHFLIFILCSLIKSTAARHAPLTALSCVSLWAAGVSRLPARLAPRKSEEQRQGWGVPPLFLQAPKQGSHFSIQCDQPERQQQVPGAQRARQTEQRWACRANATLLLFWCHWLATLSISSDASLPEDWRQIWDHQFQPRLLGRWAGASSHAARQWPPARPTSP